MVVIKLTTIFTHNLHITMKLKTIKKLSILLIGMMAMMTSCVQGDLYELYEDDDLSFSTQRQKKNKDVSTYSAQCGVWCLSYLTGKEPRVIETFAHDSCHIDCGGNDEPLTGSKILEIGRRLNCGFTDWIGTHSGGMVDYLPITSVLSSISGNFIVDLNNAHYVVGTGTNKTKKGEWVIYTIDPQNGNSRGTYSISDGQVWGIVY